MDVMQGCCWVADSIVPIVSNVFKFLNRLCTGMDEANALVHALCLSCGRWVS